MSMSIQHIQDRTVVISSNIHAIKTLQSELGELIDQQDPVTYQQAVNSSVERLIFIGTDSITEKRLPTLNPLLNHFGLNEAKHILVIHDNGKVVDLKDKTGEHWEIDLSSLVCLPAAIELPPIEDPVE